MKASTRAKLAEAEAYCNENDKSTAFMIQYMQDYAGVSFDCVMAYLRRKSQEIDPKVAKKIRAMGGTCSVAQYQEMVRAAKKGGK